MLSDSKIPAAAAVVVTAFSVDVGFPFTGFDDTTRFRMVVVVVELLLLLLVLMRFLLAASRLSFFGNNGLTAKTAPLFELKRAAEVVTLTLCVRLNLSILLPPLFGRRIVAGAGAVNGIDSEFVPDDVETKLAFGKLLFEASDFVGVLLVPSVVRGFRKKSFVLA